MPEFQIIYGMKTEPKESWSIYKDASGFELVDKWGSPQEANKICKDLNQRYVQNRLNYAAMLKRLPDPIDYLSREIMRTDYRQFETQGDEFHCAELKPDGTISFYSTLYDAYDDRRSIIRLGRYLHKYTNKTDKEIGEICARYGFEFGDAIVHFAKTREEIKNVYEKGPRSCMGGLAEDFSLGGDIHPAEAYASGDFEVAYLMRDERITARCVVVPSLKVWATIYGDYTRMSAAMRELGYREYDGDTDKQNIYGLKFLIIPYENKLALPFLDFDVCVNFDAKKEFMIASRSGGCYSEYGYIYDDLEYGDDDGSSYDDDYY